MVADMARRRRDVGSGAQHSRGDVALESGGGESGGHVEPGLSLALFNTGRGRGEASKTSMAIARWG